MILYHGSFLEIVQPDLIHSRPNVDFGRGFYVTPLYEQAAKWCAKFKRRGKDGIISRYEFDESREGELKTLKFDSYSEEWLSFILNCRSGKDLTNYDLVAGGVANDKVFNTVELHLKLPPIFRQTMPLSQMMQLKSPHPMSLGMQ